MPGQHIIMAAKLGGPFGSSRDRGLSLRNDLDAKLDGADKVIVDFSGVEASQSFLDEFIGVLVLKYGPNVLKRLAFKGCSTEVRAIIQFVVNSRANDHFIRESSSH